MGLVVHVKTGMSRDATGIVGYGNPILLGSTMADPTLSKTRWLLVHGGFPFDKETGPHPPPAQRLRRRHRCRTWCARRPSWVSRSGAGSSSLPSVSASPPTPLRIRAAAQLRWPELTFLGAETTRAALAIALSRMVTDGLVTKAQALEIGKGVLRDNALALHGLVGSAGAGPVGCGRSAERVAR